MDEITIIIISAAFSFLISLIISFFTAYVAHTTLGCYLGMHQYEREGGASSTPIEYHMICYRCGKPKTVYRKQK